MPSYGYAYNLKSNKLTETKFSGDSKKTSHLFQSTTVVPPKAGKTANVLDIFLRNFPHSSPLNQSYLEKHQPFILNPEIRSLISYDDPTTFRAKAKFVLRHGLSGVEVFDATGDTDDNILLRSVAKVLA
ncbi:hypothetical protein BY996DRAFT_8683193 [Phakopsora pachyrhizi]|nr:hypothetical protein BY996DRAFT_8683193 [Phakopsora pachyrhizi]